MHEPRDRRAFQESSSHVAFAVLSARRLARARVLSSRIVVSFHATAQAGIAAFSKRRQRLASVLIQLILFAAWHVVLVLTRAPSFFQVMLAHIVEGKAFPIVYGVSWPRLLCVRCKLFSESKRFRA